MPSTILNNDNYSGTPPNRDSRAIAFGAASLHGFAQKLFFIPDFLCRIVFYSGIAGRCALSGSLAAPSAGSSCASKKIAKLWYGYGVSEVGDGAANLASAFWLVQMTFRLLAHSVAVPLSCRQNVFDLLHRRTRR